MSAASKGNARREREARREPELSQEDARAVRLGEEARELLAAWLVACEDQGRRPQATPEGIGEALAYIRAHHSEPDAIGLRLDTESRTLVISITHHAAIESLSVQGTFTTV